MTRAGEPPDPSRSGEYFWSQRQWWRRVGTTSLAVWGSTAFAFVGTVVAARALGPDEYGAVVLAIATAGFVTFFLDLTLMDGVVHHGFRVLEAGELGSLRALLRAAFTFDLCVGVVVAALLMALAGPLADIASGGEIDPWLIRLAALVGLVSTVDSTTAAILMLKKRADLLGWTMAVTYVTRVLAIIVVVQLVDGPGPVVGAYVLAALVGAVVQFTIAWRVGWKEWTRVESTRDARSWVRPLVSFGIHSSLAGTFQSTEKALVPILLGALSSPAAAGVFNVALLPVTVVLTAINPLRLMLLPEQSGLAARGEVAALRKSVRGFTKLAFAVALPGAAAGFFLLPVLIPALFTDQFDGAVEPARILLIAAVFQFAIGSWAKIFPVAIGRPRLRSTMSGAYMLVSVALTALLAADQGSTGGAIATSAAAASTSIAWWFVAERVLGQPLPPPDVEAEESESADRAEALAPEPPPGELRLPS